MKCKKLNVENIIYLALGFLIASLLALVTMSRVWKRAVRLTKRRLESDKPVTRAEILANKDQLRAEFALSTRQLEKTIEVLREKLSLQLAQISENKNENAILKSKQIKLNAIIDELSQDKLLAKERIFNFEKQVSDLSQRLRMRERELSEVKAKGHNLNSSLFAQKNENADLKSKNIEQQNIIKEFDKAEETIKTQIFELGKQSSELQKKLDFHENLLKENKAKRDRINSQINSKKNKTSSPTLQQNDQQAAIEKLDKKIRTTKEQITRLKNQGSALCELHKSHEKELQIIRNQSAAISNSIKNTDRKSQVTLAERRISNASDHLDSLAKNTAKQITSKNNEADDNKLAQSGHYLAKNSDANDKLKMLKMMISDLEHAIITKDRYSNKKIMREQLQNIAKTTSSILIKPKDITNKADKNSDDNISLFEKIQKFVEKNSDDAVSKAKH